MVALLAEGVDRNAAIRGYWEHNDKSPSSRRAWIEIPLERLSDAQKNVALLAEGVDRNAAVRLIRSAALAVALLAEGVDRNDRLPDYWLCKAVALLAEGVDRNIKFLICHFITLLSPSSRRAWIEIVHFSLSAS